MTSPLGDILFLSEGKGLSKLIFREGNSNVPIVDNWIYSETVFLEVRSQLNDYFAGKVVHFSVKIDPQGTNFQREVWDLLADIKFSHLKTYTDIALAMNRPKAVRAVANAIGANPILIIIPCHRVIGSNAKLTGFSAGIEFKIKLLRFENAKLDSSDTHYIMF